MSELTKQNRVSETRLRHLIEEYSRYRGADREIPPPYSEVISAFEELLARRTGQPPNPVHQEFAEMLQYWIDSYELHEGVTDDTHVIEPPSWPTVGLLKRWIEALRPAAINASVENLKEARMLWAHICPCNCEGCAAIDKAVMAILQSQPVSAPQQELDSDSKRVLYGRMSELIRKEPAATPAECLSPSVPEDCPNTYCNTMRACRLGPTKESGL